MALPQEIPAGSRIVVRVIDGVDPTDHRTKFRDFVGHVRAWDGRTLELTRDAAANGSRPAQRVSIEADVIATIKPVPERPDIRP
ncbi:hypothetical protein BLEM_0165 [Bifidobacterium lemurum]|uniref:Uncharacterized protein n=1 Tax=Bifidobacterium lemurum TaxID=1603886 RepID=A0A261FWD4_9BIFI|nr:DUF6725 family protein [Bifidobacterium lemurum]OZG63462.1 hypothetical protein BLEM_0165 [Bifidobacterium lemurum]QOL34363.1 hypothetical protein BL8807_11780 [Bifidobacterium lemurum]